MDVSTKTDEVFEDDILQVQTLFSPASLELNEEEWCQLIHTDVNLAAQVGVYLLERSKDLEMIIKASEGISDEQRARADHNEKQVKYLRETIELQSKAYENFEKQVEELTRNYRDISDECRQYKEKNKHLWESVESLELNCEEYLNEIQQLKIKRMDSMTPSHLTVPTVSSTENICNDETNSDIISLRVFSEETSRRVGIERSQRVNCEYKLEKAVEEIKDLRNHITWLEHRLQNKTQDANGSQQISKLTKCTSMISLEKLDSELNTTVDQVDSGKDYTEISIGYVPYILSRWSQNDGFQNSESDEQQIVKENVSDTRKNTNSYFCDSCGRERKRLQTVSLNVKTQLAGKTLSSYREMFAEIFEKLKISRESVESK